MKTTLFKKPYLYSKMDKENPEEIFHRRAKFLIYKSLQDADDFIISRRDHGPSSFLRLKLFLLKVKIGKSLTKLRRGLVSAAKFGEIRKHSQGGVKALKKMFHCGATSELSRPIFTLQV